MKCERVPVNVGISDVPCGERVVITRSVVVIPLHDASAIQHGLFFTEGR